MNAPIARPGLDPELRDLLAERGHHQADVIVSALPWTAFAASTQRDLLEAVTGTLAPGGAFTTFACTYTRWTPPARRLRRSLVEWFEKVLLSRTVWADLPPALAHICRRPRP
ncbi:hypothetical protein AB0395_06395 [Streptosporangium sp. NPDC051023]|uniref:hypothetical protein n=1 Tax=Streptosporangium sp. NPDC051023 TaxID=3155410 RepID=UPI00344D960E